MRIDLATIALFGALQALLLAPLLLAATRAYAGVARTSLRIWGTVLLLQVVGWILMGLRGQVSDWLSIVLANGVLMISYAGTAYALRLLLGAPRRRVLLAAIGAIGWLGIAWFGVVVPDYRMRVYIATLALGAYLLLLVWPLRHALRRGGSTAQRVMLLVLLGALLGWCARLGDLAFHPATAAGLLAYSPANAAQMIYSAVEPALASIGFLLMYNEAVQAELHRLARTDPLTGTLNRLALDEEAQRLFRQAEEQAGELATLMIDADHFKAINDRFGHAGGDRVLAALATCIGGHLRASDVLGRAGGEEFLVLLPDTDAAGAGALAERMRQQVARLRPLLGGEAQTITISIGVAARLPQDHHADALIHRADRALYTAKRAGRNRVATLSAIPARDENHGT
ncbi:MAG TPA: GGDEF domain-containing protein [Rhodanobacter sp.]|nr:GGDEF domain-containing protein [Rhodanobacter sp.]